MRERAEEIGWDLKILTSPGAGTSIRVEKKPS
jgi:signal transduction histidine kinase